MDVVIFFFTFFFAHSSPAMDLGRFLGEYIGAYLSSYESGRIGLRFTIFFPPLDRSTAYLKACMHASV